MILNCFGDIPRLGREVYRGMGNFAEGYEYRFSIKGFCIEYFDVEKLEKEIRENIGYEVKITDYHQNIGLD